MCGLRTLAQSKHKARLGLGVWAQSERESLSRLEKQFEPELSISEPFRMLGRVSHTPAGAKIRKKVSKEKKRCSPVDSLCPRLVLRHGALRESQLPVCAAWKTPRSAVTFLSDQQQQHYQQATAKKPTLRVARADDICHSFFVVFSPVLVQQLLAEDMPSAGLFVPGSSPGSRPHMRVDISLDINLASLRFELQRFLPGVTTAQVRDIAVDNDGDLGLIFAWATRDASATCGRNTALVTVGSFVAVTEQGQGSGSAADAAPREWRGHVVKLDQGGETVVVANDTNHKEYINIKAATQVRPILLRSVRGFVVSPTRLATAYSAERKPSKALANAAGEGKLDVPFWNRVWAHVWQDTLDSTNFATLAKWDAKSRSGNAPKLRAHDALALKEVFRVYFLEQQPAQIVSHADPNAKPAAVPRGLGGDARPLQKRFSKWNAREHRAFLRAYASGLSLQEAVRLVPTRSKDQVR